VDRVLGLDVIFLIFHMLSILSEDHLDWSRCAGLTLLGTSGLATLGKIKAESLYYFFLISLILQNFCAFEWSLLCETHTCLCVHHRCQVFLEEPNLHALFYNFRTSDGKR